MSTNCRLPGFRGLNPAMSTTKKPLLIGSSRSWVITQMPAGPGTVMSEILRMILYWLCPFQGASEFSQQFIETLRARVESAAVARHALVRRTTPDGQHLVERPKMALHQ